jgi:predicted phage terminase large subunit-like protein
MLAIHDTVGRWIMADHLSVLNRLLVEVATGALNRLMIAMPPRHGKSWLTSCYLPAWYLGTYPDRRVILASYEADFASSWGRKARDVLTRCTSLFGVRVRGDSSAASRWDIQGHEGGMITAGVGGPITGRGADLLIIDDPIKNAEEAQSETYRAKAWDWYESTAYTRLEPGGRIVLIQTRWHNDDLAGRILRESAEPWTTAIWPAIAEADDPLGRAPGAPLWPDRYPIERLMEIKQAIGPRWFGALYQQRPVPAEGLVFRREWFPTVDAAPVELESVRYWDMAASAPRHGRDPDWTVGVLMGRTAAGIYYVLDVRRVQATPGDIETLIRRTAEQDGRDVAIAIEEEPGASGKMVIDYYVKALAGWRVHGCRLTGDKRLRAEPLAIQAQAGNVRLLRAPWNKAFLDELEEFPVGRHDDQVDAASGAFGRLVRKRQFAMWV